MQLGHDWRVGDRVLAPWEPQWLYPGKILCIDFAEPPYLNLAFIRFDDGDRGLAPLLTLETTTVRLDEEIHCRRDRNLLRYYPARVLAVLDDELRVRYEEDCFEELIDISYCRLPLRGTGER